MCVCVCVGEGDIKTLCENTMYMCKGGSGGMNSHKTFDQRTFNSFQKMNNKYNEIDMIKFLPSTCVTFIGTISRYMICIR